MKMRNNALKFKHKMRTKELEAMSKKNNFSSKDYESKKIDLDKWMARESKQLK
jgi:hypothetical protein